MDTRRIKKLIELVKETGIGELEVKSGDDSVRISCSAPAQPVTTVAATTTAPTPTPTPTPDPTAAATDPAPGVADAAPAAVDGYQQRSPMVGTVYLAPSPGAKPFVAVGDHVEAGDTLCMIEAMKMFNKIEADKSGIVSARMIDNEQVVEFDQVLFILDVNE